MPILFAISVLALVALLWAAISAAQHIRRARRRRQRSLGAETVASFSGRIGLQVPAATATKAVSFEEVTPYREAVISRPATPTPSVSVEVPRSVALAPRVPMVMPEPPYVPAPAYVPKLTFAQVSPFLSVGETHLAKPMAEAPLPPPVQPAHSRRFGSGLFSSARIQSDEDEAGLVEPPVPQMQPPPAAIDLQTPAAINDTPVPKKPSTALRPSASRLSLVASSGKMERPDWAYFNKDMGDLTDPYESPRIRPRAASGDSRR